MPTYEYHCKTCDRDFEVEKRMSDPVEQTCLLCGSPDTQRLISHTTFVLKGSGWYVTDYARKNGSNGNGSRAHRSSPDSGASSRPETPATSGPSTGPSTAPATSSADTKSSAPVSSSSPG